MKEKRKPDKKDKFILKPYDFNYFILLNKHQKKIFEVFNKEFDSIEVNKEFNGKDIKFLYRTSSHNYNNPPSDLFIADEGLLEVYKEQDKLEKKIRKTKDKLKKLEEESNLIKEFIKKIFYN